MPKLGIFWEFENKVVISCPSKMLLVWLKNVPILNFEFAQKSVKLGKQTLRF